MIGVGIFLNFYIMKKVFFFTIVALSFFIIFQSCKKESPIDDVTLNFENVNISKLLEIKERLHFENKVDLGKYENYIEFQSYKDKEDRGLNNFITNEINKKNRIDAVVFFHKKDKVNGIGMYAYDFTTKSLNFYLFRVQNSKLIEIEDFPKITINYIFKDITFVANNYFNNSSIDLVYRDINLDYPNLSKNYNDLALTRVIYKLKTAGYLKGNTQQKTKPRGDGCGMTFSCVNGESGAACIPSGCIGTCRYEDVKNSLSNSSFNRLLPENKLYQFKDFLLTTNKGRIFNDTYYRLGSYFYGTLDTELSIETIATASTVRSIIDRLLDNSFSGVIINETEADSLIGLLQLSKSKSNNMNYHEVISLLINELNSLRNKNKDEFITQLNV